MAIAGIPEIINNFNLYLAGRQMPGGITGEVKTPDFESMVSSTSGVGILGEYDAIAIGHYSSMVQEIPFRCINEDYWKLVNPAVPVELTLRGAIQYSERATQRARQMGMRIIYRGRCKKIVIGTVKQRGPMDSSISLELTYIKVEMDGKPRVELDKLNNVFKVNGVDMLAEIKRYT